MADTSKDIVVGTQVVDCGDPDRFFTFANDGAGSIFYMKRNTAVTLVGTGAEITALGASKLLIGQSVVVPGVAYDVVCGSDTGVTAIMRLMEGAVSASINATITGVTVNQDLDKIAGTAITVNAASKTNGTQVVNQATDGVNGVAFGLAADVAAVDGSFHAKLEYIGIQAATVVGAIRVEDTIHTSLSDTGMAVWGVRTDTRTSLANTDGYFAPFQFTANGDLRTRDDDLITLAETSGGGIYFRQDSTATIAKETGGNLASLAGAVSGTSVQIVTPLVEAVPAWLTVVVTTPGTPEPFAVNGTFATYVSVEAKRADGDNVDDVYVRNSSVDKTTAQGHVLGPGDPWDYRAAPGTKFDMNDLQFDAINTDDGLTICYAPA